jgi:hypothetical protein
MEAAQRAAPRLANFDLPHERVRLSMTPSPYSAREDRRRAGGFLAVTDAFRLRSRFCRRSISWKTTAPSGIWIPSAETGRSSWTITA